MKYLLKTLYLVAAIAGLSLPMQAQIQNGCHTEVSVGICQPDIIREVQLNWKNNIPIYNCDAPRMMRPTDSLYLTINTTCKGSMTLIVKRGNKPEPETIDITDYHTDSLGRTAVIALCRHGAMRLQACLISGLNISNNLLKNCEFDNRLDFFYTINNFFKPTLASQEQTRYVINNADVHVHPKTTKPTSLFLDIKL